MNLVSLCPSRLVRTALNLVLFAAPVVSQPALAQDVTPPHLVSVAPADGASGVAASAPVVFVFSEAMDVDVTAATFFTTSFPPQLILVTEAWSSGGTRLTCTPMGSWPANATVQWAVSGVDLEGNDLSTDPLPFGRFSTGAGGGGQTGSGTNAVTTFQIGVTHQYQQTSLAPPVFDPEVSYLFNAGTILASNRTATNITVLLPTATTQKLNAFPTAPEAYFFYASSTNAAAFNPSYNGGNYAFTVRSISSNQTVTVNLPANGQPSVPRVANFAAAQSVNDAQPFTLSWDAFTGGFASGSVTNFITVEVEDDFPNAGLGDPEVLPKNATSVTIPVGRLRPNATYEASVAFWTAIRSTNSSATNTMVWRVTRTTFPLVTAGGGGSALVLTNWARLAGGVVQFEVVATPGQNFVVERADAIAAQSWNTVLTTNAVTGRVAYREAVPAGAKARFYRARRLN